MSSGKQVSVGAAPKHLALGLPPPSRPPFQGALASFRLLLLGQSLQARGGGV